MNMFGRFTVNAILFAVFLIPSAAYPAKSKFSIWTKEEISALPESFLTAQKNTERQWNSYRDSISKAYKSEYGNDINSGFDLFLKEQGLPKMANSNVLESKNLGRPTDIVWIEGKQAKAFSGQPVFSLKILSFRENRLHIIPADIIEFTKDGKIVLPFGPEANMKDADGVLSDNDRIFFMAMDAGHRINRDIITSAYRNIGAIQEIEISSPSEKEKAWVYLVSFTSDIPKCGFDLVSLFPDASVIYTPYMFIQARPQKNGGRIYPTVNVCSWLISPEAGGTMADVHNRFYINIAMAYRMGITKTQDQDAFDLRWRAWYDGQVIGMIRVSWKLSTPLGIGAPTIFTDVLITPFTLRDENFIATPFDPGIIIKTYTQSIGEDLNRTVLSPDSRPALILTSANKKGCAVEGKMKSSEVIEEKKGTKSYLWHALTSQFGSMCVISGLNPFLSEYAKFRLEYFDGANNPGRYMYDLELSNFKNRQENMYIEWNVLPFFNENNKLDMKMLDLVLKHAGNPLSIKTGMEQPVQLPQFTHIPNIKNEMKNYKY
ncbi:MAG TPA: hypothetical protein VIS94_00345 [Desulfomonilia bacterium]